MTINEHNMSNPLKTWGDVGWYCMWLEGMEGFQHYVVSNHFGEEGKKFNLKNLIGLDGF
jgi:hypothetical protein